jgi:fatty acid desaturase
MIAHHTCHGGYNKQDDGSGRFTSMGFALGSVRRRAMDWLDWMLPEAWNVEHNNLHHFRTGEPGDPDLVERNLQTLRDIPMVPRPVKYAFVALIACMWKWYYYAPNTYKQLKMHELRRSGKGVPESVDIHAPFAITKFLPGAGSEAPALGYNFLDYLKTVAGPYLAIRFFLLPAPLLLINPLFFRRAVVNLLLADALSNLHSFIIIATNHAGDDMYQFENSVTPKSGSFYMRQVITSVNFRTSNGIRADGTARPVHGHTADANDFMHGWLNYQIEHHLWPQLSMLSYQKAAPELRAICAKHGVPYVQHSVFRRLKKTADIMVGATSMRKFRPEWEKEADRFEWKS